MFPECFKSMHTLLVFRVVLRVDLVLRVVNGVLVAVIVHSICIPNSCIFDIAKTGLEVLSLHPPSFRQSYVNNGLPRSIANLCLPLLS